MLFAHADCPICLILSRLAPFITIMYISSAFPIDHDSSGRQCSHIATTYNVVLHLSGLYSSERRRKMVDKGIWTME